MKPEQIQKLIAEKMQRPKLHIGLQKAIHHELTCNDLSHGHGIVRIRWDKPERPNSKGEQ